MQIFYYLIIFIWRLTFDVNNSLKIFLYQILWRPTWIQLLVIRAYMDVFHCIELHISLYPWNEFMNENHQYYGTSTQKSSSFPSRCRARTICFLSTEYKKLCISRIFNSWIDTHLLDARTTFSLQILVYHLCCCVKVYKKIKKNKKHIKTKVKMKIVMAITVIALIGLCHANPVPNNQVWSRNVCVCIKNIENHILLQDVDVDELLNRLQQWRQSLSDGEFNFLISFFVGAQVSNICVCPEIFPILGNHKIFIRISH